MERAGLYTKIYQGGLNGIRIILIFIDQVQLGIELNL